MQGHDPLQEPKLFIESSLFPLEVVNRASEMEKGPGRPPHWEMVFWWTRKPHAGARALLLASVLPASEIKGREDVERFLRAVYPTLDMAKYRRGEIKFTRAPHRENPRIPDKWRRYLQDKTILDPMAGYGTIPLEAARLGFKEVHAWDLLPIARLFIKAILEYPAWLAREGLAKQAIKDLEEAGTQILEALRNDSDIKELYDEDVAVYIGTWEVKCPHCGRYTPIIGNWWLARVKEKKGYKALAYMQPQKQGGTITIKPIDLTSEIPKAKTIKVTESEITIVYKTGEKRVYKLPNNGKPTKTPKKDQTICLHCQNPINQKKNGKWIVKEYIRQYNQILEQYLQGKTTLENLKNSPARPILLIKVKTNGKQLTFHPATQQDQEKLWKALEKLRQQWPDSDIPTESIPSYETRRLIEPYGFDKWFKLFNPRQLLTLTKLTKLIRQTGKKIQQQKQQGWQQEKARKYAETITTYLTIALLRYAEHTSLATPWTTSTGFGSVLALKPANIMTYRGIAMVWNWCETLSAINFAGSYIRALDRENTGLSYLVSVVSDSQSMIRVMHDINNGMFSVVVTDPPYLDDVPYAELSDFYYVWAKRALSDNDGVGLRPLFNSELFFDEFGNEIGTQWEAFAAESLDYNRLRMEYFGLCRGEEECLRVYRRRFAGEFRRLAGLLADGGVLVLYFAHSRREAWDILVEALLGAGLRVTAGLPLVTESEASIVSRGKHSILQSMVLVARKAARAGVLDLDSGEEGLVAGLAGFVDELYRSGHDHGVTVFNMTFAKALGILMGYERVLRGGRVLGPGGLTSEAGRLAVLAMVRRSGSRVSSSVALAYAVLKHALSRIGGERRRVSSDTLILMGYAIGESRGLVDKRVVVPAGKPGRGADVAKRKVYVLLEPVEDSEAAFNALIESGRDGRPLVEHALDVYRLLAVYSFRPKSVFMEYYSRLQGEYPELVGEAVELARALAILRDKRDPDRLASRRILEYLEIDTPDRGEKRVGGLDRYVS